MQYGSWPKDSWLNVIEKQGTLISSFSDDNGPTVCMFEHMCGHACHVQIFQPVTSFTLAGSWGNCGMLSYRALHHLCLEVLARAARSSGGRRSCKTGVQNSHDRSIGHTAFVNASARSVPCSWPPSWCNDGAHVIWSPFGFLMCFGLVLIANTWRGMLGGGIWASGVLSVPRPSGDTQPSAQA